MLTSGDFASVALREQLALLGKESSECLFFWLLISVVLFSTKFNERTSTRNLPKEYAFFVCQARLSTSGNIKNRTT